MIDFNLSDNDQKVLDYVRSEALVARKYARHYDENEAEFPPEQARGEAKDFPGVWSLMGDRGAEDSGRQRDRHADHHGRELGATTSIRMRKGRGVGLGNAALAASGTPEQREKWGGLLLSMAITEPGCGSDPSLVQTSAVLDEETDEWVLNGEKIFVTTGCRSDGVVLWATLDRSAGRAGIKSFLVEKETPGFIVSHKEKKLGIRADDTANLRLPGLPHPAGETCWAARRRSRRRGSGGFRGVMKTFNHDPAHDGRLRARHVEGRARLHARAARGGGRGAGLRTRHAWALRGRSEVPAARGAPGGGGADGAARGVALRPGRAQQPGGLDLEGEGRGAEFARSPRGASSCSGRWGSHASTSSRSGSGTFASPTSTRVRGRSRT